MIIYLADLSTFYERQGRMTEARDLAWRVIETIPRHPMDSAIRADAQARWPVLAGRTSARPGQTSSAVVMAITWPTTTSPG